MTRGFLRFVRGNTIALLALFIALGGTDLRRHSAAGEQRGGEAAEEERCHPREDQEARDEPEDRNNAVTGAKTKNDSLTGADVLESSLGKVPSRQRR